MRSWGKTSKSSPIKKKTHTRHQKSKSLDWGKTEVSSKKRKQWSQSIFSEAFRLNSWASQCLYNAHNLFWPTVLFRIVLVQPHWRVSLWTARLRSHQNIPLGFKSGLWLGHCKCLPLLFFLPFRGRFVFVLFGLLYRCITQLCLSRTFSFRIFWQTAEFVCPTFTEGRPGCAAAKQPHSTPLPLPCLTVATMFSVGSTLALHRLYHDPCLPKSSTFDSSGHRPFCPCRG